jgi:hypothetical protein
MSDIYLQITETPTVVTLSSPVISGALSSTVTVANTVTVALDSNSLNALENVTVTVGAAITGTVTVANFPATQAVSLASVPTHGVTLAGTTVTVSSMPAISGSVTANVSGTVQVSNISTFPDGANNQVVRAMAFGYSGDNNEALAIAAIGDALKVSGQVDVNSIPSISGTVEVTNSQIQVAVVDPIPAGTNSIGVVTIGAGTSQIGSVTASISNTVVTIFPSQGTTVTNSNFTSITPSTTLVSAVAGREVLTVFNEGAGNLHISPGATCTVGSYQVRLSAGDYWECPAGQTSLAHTAVFATAGTARITQVS